MITKAAKRLESGVFAPACTLTAVREKLPDTGKLLKTVGRSFWAYSSSKGGGLKEGNPLGIGPTISTPYLYSSNFHTIKAKRATTKRGAGKRGFHFFRSFNRTIPEIPRAKVSQCIWSIACSTFQRRICTC